MCTDLPKQNVNVFLSPIILGKKLFSYCDGKRREQKIFLVTVLLFFRALYFMDENNGADMNGGT